MWNAQVEVEWRRLSEEVLGGVTDWWTPHPKATI